jgi:hypothetical protein
MRLSDAIELYVADMRRCGRINADRTEQSSPSRSSSPKGPFTCPGVIPPPGGGYSYL